MYLDLNPKQTIMNNNIFSIPAKLYGRDADLEYMLQSFNRIKEGNTEIIMIGGYSGVGKSSLVGEFEQILKKESLPPFFITGKSEKSKQNIPYYPILQAFEEIVEDTLNTSSEAEQLLWRKKLQTAVGGLGKALTDLIPNIEKIIGKQPDIPVVSGQEAISRLNQVFIRFITTIATRKRPLILFIDDLQWVDSASLYLLENITNNSAIKYLMFIGAYRDNEIDEKHLLAKTLANIQNKSLEEGRRVVFSMNLHNLSEEDIHQMVADSLKEKTTKVERLSNIIYKKTYGNPFFSRQLLLRLYEDGWIRYNNYRTRWEADIEEISAIKITDNVVDLMVNKIKALPESTRDILKIAACIGRTFDIKTIEVINQRLNTDSYDTIFNATVKHLEKSEIEGLILKNKEQYTFAHDKIHQAVNSLNSEVFKKKIHLHLGRWLFRNRFKENFDFSAVKNLKLSSEELFNIINHWNKGIVFIDSKVEKSQLAALNLVAGKRAAATAAYQAALSYLNEGVSLLYEDSWDKDYELSLALYSDIMEIEYLIRKLDNLEPRFNYILKNAREHIDTTKAYEILIQSANVQNDFRLAIVLGSEILEKLGVALPKKTNNFHLFTSLVKIIALMWGKNIKKLADLPDMTAPKSKAIMRIFYAIAVPIYLSRSKLLFPYIYAGLKHTLKNGNSEDSVLAYAGYGLIANTVLGNYDKGVEVNKLLSQLIAKYDANRNSSFVHLISNTFLEHPKYHIGNKIASLKEAYYSEWQKGQLELNALIGFSYIYFSFYQGTPLVELIKELEDIKARTQNNKQVLILHRMNIYQQTWVNLSQNVKNPTSLTGAFFSENEIIPKELEANKKIISFQFLINKALLCYLFGEYINAAYYTLENEDNISLVRGTYMERIHYFYATLAYCKAFEIKSHWSNDFRGRQRLKIRIKDYTKILKSYSEHGHQNFLHKYKLARAEGYRIENKINEAKEAYRVSILLAEKESFINEAALACELAGYFYYQNNELLTAKEHIEKAIKLYIEWQAFSKVKHLETIYKSLLQV
jgi:predicted ATPase